MQQPEDPRAAEMRSGRSVARDAGSAAAGPVAGTAAGRPEVVVGRLVGDVPSSGEAFRPLAEVGGARVEHIVSSAAPDHSEQVQAWDEWVLVVAGAARLGLPGGELALRAGDWVMIPAGTPHRVLATERGTQWIAVHGEGPVAQGDR